MIINHFSARRFTTKRFTASVAITVTVAATVASAALTLFAPQAQARALAPPAALAPTTGEQIIDADQEQGTGRVVRDSGHLDFGPTRSGDSWELQIHDDSEATSYWRALADVAIRVKDEALLTVPDTPEFSFLPAAAGAKVHVIPQTQQPGVVWLGWNTQQPEALASMGQGVTVTVTNVTGPGDVSVFLQNGNFGAPDELWNSAELPGAIWMERNTHTHANWVFTAPGAYLLDITFEAELADGSTAKVSDSLRFAVGDSTDPEAAFSLKSTAPSAEDAGAEHAGGRGSGQDGGTGGPDGGLLTQPVLIGAGVAVAILALAGLVVAIAARSRRRARVGNQRAVDTSEVSE